MSTHVIKGYEYTLLAKSGGGGGGGLGIANIQTKKSLSLISSFAGSVFMLGGMS